MAASRTVDPSYAVHSLHSYFLRPGDTAVPIVFDVETLRDGRSFETRRVVARQHGRPIYLMSVSFQLDEPGLEHQDDMPDVPGPEHGLPLSSRFDARGSAGTAEWQREWAALDVRYIGNSKVGGVADDPARPARAQLWVRVSGVLGDDPLEHQAAFTYASDMTLIGAALVPHDKEISSPDLQAASLDHTIWFHRPFRADDWLLYDQRPISTGGARGLAGGNIFTAAGALAITVVQEGLVRVPQA